MRLDAAARSVSAAVFLAAFRLIGQITLLLAILSFMLSITMGSTGVAGWWIMPLLMAIYGGLISWCTRSSTTMWPGSTASVGSAMKATPARAQTPVKSASAKKRR